MKNLKIKPQKGVFYIPHVEFNAESGICLLEGESYLEKTDDFYEALAEWLQEYIQEIAGPIQFNFKLLYFVSGSTIGILEILKVLKKYKESGGNVTINWYYLDEDDSNYDEGEDLMLLAGIRMNFLQYDTTVYDT